MFHNIDHNRRMNGPKVFSLGPFVLCCVAMLLLLASITVRAQTPKFVIGAVPLGTLTMKKGNLDCKPYDCSIKLKSGQSFKPFQNEKHIFELLQDGKVIQYYFYSNDITNIPAYSGQPIGILIALNPKADIADTRLIEHDEPILLAGIPVSKLVNAVKSYRGKNIRDQIIVGRPKKGYVTVDMITGATVTSLVVNETVLASSRIVARKVGILKDTQISRVELSKTFTPRTWEQLVKMGAIGHLKITQQEMELPPSDQPWLDLYFADLVQPTIGINILGKPEYEDLMSSLKPGQSAIMVAGSGTWNFKGSAFVRGGIFDRFQIEQGLKTFTFRDLNYHPLYNIMATGAPYINQSGVFIITSPEYRRAEPWTLVVLGSRLTGKTAVSKLYKTFTAEYHFPKSLLIKKIIKPEVAPIEQPSLIKQIWGQDKLGISWYLFLWLFVMGVLTFRKRIASSQLRISVIHNTVLVISILTVGLYQQGQPSVVNVYTFFHVLVTQGSFSLFLLDPYIALGWIMIIITTVIWGRSLFCGWICPFGALQELLYNIRKRIMPFKKRIDFNKETRRYLRSLRYIIFITLFIISLYSIKIAELLSEVEPFKTTWNIGLLHRPAAYGLYVVILFLIGTFIYRFFCRYLCPLGAGLSILSFFPLRPIARRNACLHCRICRAACEPHAINSQGQINPAECLACLTCINKMYDKKVCPPLVSKKIWDKYNEKPV